jgi:hypothetical protein
MKNLKSLNKISEEQNGAAHTAKKVYKENKDDNTKEEKKQEKVKKQEKNKNELDAACEEVRKIVLIDIPEIQADVKVLAISFNEHIALYDIWKFKYKKYKDILQKFKNNQKIIIEDYLAILDTLGNKLKKISNKLGKFEAHQCVQSESETESTSDTLEGLLQFKSLIYQIDKYSNLLQIHLKELNS